MKVILTTNIKKLGIVGDLVNVKDGFARNFLFPQKMALRNTKNNKEYFDKIRDEINAKEAKNILSESGLDIIPANDMKDAAQKVVDASKNN